MYEKIIIQDYITRIRQIINSNSPDKREQLHRLIHSVRKINNRHLYKCSVNLTVGKLLEPHWMTTVRKFDLQQWQDTAERVWRSTSKILESIPPPEIVLYPGFKRFNGRVYKVDRKPVIGCSPDYPRISNDRNLKVLLAHEYAHFIRWRQTGIPSDNVPIYALIYEEGWAIWLSIKLLPHYRLSQIFMSNLHKEINMPDPEGGYLLWCRENFRKIISEARKVLISKNDKDLGRFFQCRRFGANSTPIRAGYYLGYRLLERLATRMTPVQLLGVRPTAAKISSWLGELSEE